MDKTGKILRWTGSALGVLVLVAAAAGVIYTHTDAFRELVRQKTLAALNENIRGRVDVDRIEGSIWSHLTLRGVRVSLDGEDIARIARLQIQHSLWPLLWRRFQILRLTAAEPQLSLVQHADGRWNIIEAFQPVKPEASEAPGLVVSVNAIEASHGEIALRLSERPLYTFSDVEFRGTLAVETEGVAVDLERLSTRMKSANLPEVRVAGALGYQNRILPASIHFEDLLLESGASALKVSGTLRGLDAPITEARVTLVKLAPVDVARLLPKWPVRSDISGRIDLRGPLSALEGRFSLAAADGNLTGTFHADVSGAQVAYRSGLKLTGVNVGKLLERSDLQGIVSGSGQVSARGFDLGRIDASAELSVRDARLVQVSLGHIAAQANLHNAVMQTSGAVQSDAGRAEWEGRVTVSGSNEYDLRFSTTRLEVAKIVPAAGAKPVVVDLSGTIQGSGFSPRSARLRTAIDVSRAEIAGVAVQDGTLVASLADERILISVASLRAGDTIVSARGQIGAGTDRPGRLEYRLQIGDLSPWLGLLGQQGAGGATVIGAAQGTLADLRAQGKVTLAGIGFQGASVARGSADYDLVYSGAAALPHGKLKLRFSGVERGYRLENLNASLTIFPGVPYRFDVQASARDEHGREHSVAGDVRYAPAKIEARLRDLIISFPQRSWRLARPALVARRKDDFIVERLSLGSNGAQIALDGRFSLSGSQDLRVAWERLPLSAFRGLYSFGTDITGVLTGEARVAGSAAAPEISARTRLQDSKIGGQTYQGLAAVLTYGNGAAAFTASVEQDKLHRLDATGRLPASLSWSKGWRFEPTGGLDARLHSAGLSIGFLNAFSGKSVRGIGGELGVDLEVRGALTAPVAQGTLNLRNGRVTPVDLGIEISSVAADALLEPRGIRIVQLNAAAGAGTLKGSGFIGVEKFSPGDLNLTLTANRWPAINTRQYEAELNGKLNVAGTAAAPRVSGNLEVLRAELRPDLAFLRNVDAPTKRDPTIQVIGAKAPATRSISNNGEVAAAPGGDLWRSVALNVRIAFPRNVWLRHANANVELTGKLTVEKAPGAGLSLSGLLEIVRGWVGFQGRRFNLVHGVATFGGGAEINPVLDVIGEYRAGEYLVRANVSGSAAKPALTLTSMPQMDQSDIMAVLLFGKPIAALNQGEAASLQQSAISLGTGFAAAHVAKAVSEALGLQQLGLDIDDVEVADGRVRVGRYVGQKTFFSVSQEISGTYGREVAVEFRITEDWRVGMSSGTEGTSGVDVIWHKRY